MKKKVGTVMEDDMLTRLRGLASQRGVTLSSLIEAAVQRYLADQQSLVERSYGALPLTAGQLEEALELDPYES